LGELKPVLTLDKDLVKIKTMSLVCIIFGMYKKYEVDEIYVKKVSIG
jgi:hypothetical protein